MHCIPVGVVDVDLYKISEPPRLGLDVCLRRQPFVAGRQTDKEDRLDPVVRVVGRARPGRSHARSPGEVVDRRVDVAEQKHGGPS